MKAVATLFPKLDQLLPNWCFQFLNVEKLARPEGLEPPTTWFEARYSIQLSYGRVL